MAELVLKNVYKQYDNKEKKKAANGYAVNDFVLGVKTGNLSGS